MLAACAAVAVRNEREREVLREDVAAAFDAPTFQSRDALVAAARAYFHRD